MSQQATTCSPSEDSPQSRSSKRRRGPPPSRIVIPDTSGGGKITTDSNELQHAIYVELTKITNSLNATSKSPATETGRHASYVTRSGGFWTSSRHVTAVRDSGDKKARLEAAEYDALGQQFTTLVIISTFTANLIIGFVTLAHNTLSGRTPYPRIKFEIGMFFALAGMAIHSGVIIIAGRSAALALKYAKRLPVQAYLKEEKERERIEKEYESERSASENHSPNDDEDKTLPSYPGKGKEPERVDPHPDRPSSRGTVQIPSNEPRGPFPSPFWQQLPQPQPQQPQPFLFSPALTENPQDLQFYDFHLFLKVCESLQLLGTAIFFLGVMVFIFIIFFHHAFPIILLLGCVVGSFSMTWKIGFWKVSATNQLVGMASKILRTWKEGSATSTTARADASTTGGAENAKFPACLKPSSLKKEKHMKRWFGVHWQDTVDVEKTEVENEKMN